MRKSHLLVALAAGFAVGASLFWMALSGPDAAAQSPARAAARPAVTPSGIALLDVGYIFKNHTRFKAMMDEVKADVSRAEAWAKSEREAITKLAERLKDFRQGSPEYKSLEEQLTKRQAERALKIQQKKREFDQHAARIYYDVYREIHQEVNYYCQAKGVALVLRFSRETPDMERPESTLLYIQKPVVTYDRNLDITDLILNQLNRRPAAGGTNPIGSRARPGVPFNR